MQRLRRRAGAAIALAVASIRLVDRAAWMTPGERVIRRVFCFAICAIGLLAVLNLIQILTGER